MLQIFELSREFIRMAVPEEHFILCDLFHCNFPHMFKGCPVAEQVDQKHLSEYPNIIFPPTITSTLITLCLYTGLYRITIVI
jgi:hypothetical protein